MKFKKGDRIVNTNKGGPYYGLIGTVIEESPDNWRCKVKYDNGVIKHPIITILEIATKLHEVLS